MITFSELGKYGRLGNQMFQVASTIGIARKHKYDAVFPGWVCNYTHKTMSFFFDKHIDQTLDASMILHQYQEPNFHFDDVNILDGTNLHGYFQTTKYFDHCEDEIRTMFKPAKFLQDKLKLKYGRILDGRTCSIHVRRGDYVNNPVHVVCDEDYYSRAVDYIENYLLIDNFLVFSDDIEWCRNYFPKDFVFVDDNLDIEDMFLMSMCDHNIISNSSFSWWSSWLNENPGKVVVTPNRWFSNAVNIDDSDIYFKNMVKI